MAYELLLARIEERLRAAEISERKACLNARIGVNSVRHIRSRAHAPKPDTLAKLAKELNTPPAYFLDAATTEGEPIALTRIFVRGAVQAGAWRQAIEWNGDEWYTVTAPQDDRFPGVERFGLEVRGTSMDRVYPAGTIVMVVRFGDIGRTPRSGERVVVLRRSPDSDDYEATLKEYQNDEQGRHILWPRSDDPEFQTPFILSSGDLPVSGGYEPLPARASAGDFSHAAGAPDITVSALVVGSYRRE
jgi:SOS-response transcriptional repressor LexA